MSKENAPRLLEYPIAAIGDLHGQLEFLDRLLAKLQKLPEWPALRIVFLGDLVDRGPGVQGTVQRVLEVIAEKPGSVCVLGNHDLAFLRAAGLDGTRSEYWVRRWADAYDHEATFRGYLGRTPEYHNFDDWMTDLDALRDAVPAEHRKFFAEMPWVAESAGHVFLHNGFSPELQESAETQLELLRRRKWHGYVHPRMGSVTEAEYKPDYPVWLGADKKLSAAPLPLPGRVQVTGHVRIAAPDANKVRIRIDTTGGIAEPLTACLLRDPHAEPVFLISDRE